MKSRIINYLFPKQCIKCGVFGEYVCARCEKKFLDVREVQQCHVCKKLIETEGKLVHVDCMHETLLDGVVVCLNYTKLTEKLIAEVKYSLFTDVVNFIAPFYFNKLKFFSQKEKEGLLLVPVPLFRKKKWARGFNQTELIAKKLIRLGLNNSFSYLNLLKRVKNTKTQVGLTREERLINLDEAFQIRSKFSHESGLYWDKTIILIDDVMTTGTTLEECANVLKTGGVRRVYAVVFTRG